MDAVTLLRIAAFALCLVMAGIGLGMALGSGNVVKRLSGLAFAHLGAIVLCVSLGAFGLALALTASMAAQTALGAAITARVSEAYGAAETDAVRGADAAEEDGGDDAR